MQVTIWDSIDRDSGEENDGRHVDAAVEGWVLLHVAGELVQGLDALVGICSEEWLDGNAQSGSVGARDVYSECLSKSLSVQSVFGISDSLFGQEDAQNGADVAACFLVCGYSESGEDDFF